jgi:transcriptional regulator with XRE-family HTH domain
MAKNGNGHYRNKGPLRLYRSYNFVDKDPVIDKVRTLVAREGLKHKDVERISGVSSTTLHNWFDGQTRRPQFATVAAVTSSLGYSAKFVKSKQVNFEREIAKAAEEIAELKEKLERRRTAEAR